MSVWRQDILATWGESYPDLHDIYEAELVVEGHVVVVVVGLVVQVSCNDMGFHIGRDVLSMAIIVVGVDHACSTGLPAQVDLRGQPNRSGVSKRPPQLPINCLTICRRVLYLYCSQKK